MKKYLILTVAILCATSAFGKDPPKLSSVKTLKFFFKEGVVFHFKDGELEEQTTDKKFSTNGELIYSITGKDKALMIGNQASGEVQLFCGETSLIFIETTTSGTKHMLTVFNTWSEKSGGFACVYHRCIDWGPLVNAQITSTFYDIAKPFD